MKKTVMVDLGMIQWHRHELEVSGPGYFKCNGIQPNAEGLWVDIHDINNCPEVKQNQTYEDWLNETIIYIKADYISISSITKALKHQANFIWQKLCEKDDKIIELERKIDEAKRIIQHMTLTAEIMKGETDE